MKQRKARLPFEVVFFASLSIFGVNIYGNVAARLLIRTEGGRGGEGGRGVGNGEDCPAGNRSAERDSRNGGKKGNAISRGLLFRRSTAIGILYTNSKPKEHRGI